MKEKKNWSFRPWLKGESCSSVMIFPLNWVNQTFVMDFSVKQNLTLQTWVKEEIKNHKHGHEDLQRIFRSHHCTGGELWVMVILHVLGLNSGYYVFIKLHLASLFKYSSYDNSLKKCILERSCLSEKVKASRTGVSLCNAVAYKCEGTNISHTYGMHIPSFTFFTPFWSNKDSLFISAMGCFFYLSTGVVSLFQDSFATCF